VLETCSCLFAPHITLAISAEEWPTPIRRFDAISHGSDFELLEDRLIEIKDFGSHQRRGPNHRHRPEAWIPVCDGR
jgi:hypothetical protein